jgi:hypothetical protein
MHPMDVKRKALQAVKGFGREGMGEELKKGYGSPAAGKPAIAIKIESTKVEPEMGEAEDEMGESEGMMPEKMPEKMMGEMGEMDEMGESEMPEDGSKLTPEMLEMLLAKLGK